MRMRQVKQRTMSNIRRKVIMLREVAVAAEVLTRRRMLCKCFSVWQNKLMSKVQRHTLKNMRKAESANVSSIPDMMAQLHSLLSRQAELETELERKDAEIQDVSAVIRDNKAQYAKIEDEIKDAMMENQRVIGLKQSIDHDYKDQIATLRMSLSKEINQTNERIEEGRQKLIQQEKAKKITSNSLFESQGVIQNKMNAIKEKLSTAQSIAIQMRDELLRNDEEQTDMSRDIIALQSEITQLRSECNELSAQNQINASANNQNLDKLKDVYAQTMEQLNQIKYRIRQNNEELSNQDARLESLTRELALCRQRSKTAMDAFKEDDENTY